jgi:hypothetical protein
MIAFMVVASQVMGRWWRCRDRAPRDGIDPERHSTAASTVRTTWWCRRERRRRRPPVRWGENERAAMTAELISPAALDGGLVVGRLSR